MEKPHTFCIFLEMRSRGGGGLVTVTISAAREKRGRTIESWVSRSCVAYEFKARMGHIQRFHLQHTKE